MAPRGGIRTADMLLHGPVCLWELHVGKEENRLQAKATKSSTLCQHILRCFNAFCCHLYATAETLIEIGGGGGACGPREINKETRVNRLEDKQ